MSDPVAIASAAIDAYGNRPHNLLAVLRQIQRQCHYLPREALKVVARHFGLPLARVEGVAEFYRDTLVEEPPPTFLLTLCGQHFGLGDSLTVAAHSHLDRAIIFVSRLLARPELASWQAACTRETKARTVPGRESP